MPRVEMEKLSNIIPYEFNNRKHSEKQINLIANSMQEFSFTNPILIDEVGFILAGHGRYYAAEKLKLETAPVIRIKHLTEPQKKAYRILDNKLALDSEWDIDSLSLDLTILQDSGFDLEGFSLDELGYLNMEQSLEEINPDISQTSLFFRIKCENPEELTAMKAHFGTTEKEITYEDFLSWQKALS